MNKLILAGLFFMYGLGSITTWFVSRFDWNQPQAIAQPTPKPLPAPEQTKDKMVDVRTIKAKTPRELLEEQYRLCVGNPASDLSRVPDAVMRQVIAKTCIEKS